MNPDNIEIYLETSDGRAVVTAYIMPFDMLPDVVYWGIRCFKHYKEKIYRECFYAPCHTKDEAITSSIPRPILEAFKTHRKQSEITE